MLSDEPVVEHRPCPVCSLLLAALYDKTRGCADRAPGQAPSGALLRYIPMTPLLPAEELCLLFTGGEPRLSIPTTGAARTPLKVCSAAALRSLPGGGPGRVGVLQSGLRCGHGSVPQHGTAQAHSQ